MPSTASTRRTGRSRSGCHTSSLCGSQRALLQTQRRMAKQKQRGRTDVSFERRMCATVYE